MIRQARVLVAASTLAIGAATAPLDAQSPATAAGSLPTQPQPAAETVPLGWTVTPGVLYGASWDDNVLVAHGADGQVGDMLNLISPRADASFNGRRNRFGAHYDGTFLLYRELSSLNGYDQHGGVSIERTLTHRTSFFVRGGVAHSPTTALEDLVAVPFMRTGATIEQARAGIETRLTKRVTLAASGNLEHVSFGTDGQFASLLRGGHGIGGAANVRRELSSLTGLIANYDVTRGTVGQAHEPFTVQNGAIGLDHRFAETRISAAAGLSHLDASVFGPSHTGLNWRADLVRMFRSAQLEASYSRDFEASYGFVGTTRTDSLATHLEADLSHGVYGQTGISWRRSDPLIDSALRFRSIWFDAALGYAARPGLRVEGFWNVTTQTIDEPDGEFGRNQVGIHVVAVRPMRIH